MWHAQMQVAKDVSVFSVMLLVLIAVDAMLSNVKPSTDENMRDIVDGQLFQECAAQQVRLPAHVLS